jgi:5,5'-dehydrodivanillate O-demethylase oxygenase subunit
MVFGRAVPMLFYHESDIEVCSSEDSYYTCRCYRRFNLVMLTQEQNERLTQTGAGTPGGEFLRRYWHPVAATADLDRETVVPVRVLGENLVLYRSTKGEIGLIQERCPHRSASLVYGIPDEDGLRCAYHGWCFDREGGCVSMPYDDTQGSTTFRDSIRIASYSVQELGGLIFAYLGPEPAPLLPRWDLLVLEDKIRQVQITNLPCSWLQCQENSLDPVHVEWLHARQGNYVAGKAGLPPVMNAVPHLKIDFEPFEYGIMKRRLLEGADPETSPDWNIGHPILFPNMLAGGSLQIRTPVDDTHTLHFLYNLRDRAPGEAPQTSVPAYDLPWQDEDGKLSIRTVLNQDFAAWIQQGAVAPRTLERLAKSDAGIAMFRRWLADNIDKVERGEDPDGLVRDPTKNEPYIVIPGLAGPRLQSVLTMSAPELESRLLSATRHAGDA